MIRKLLKRNISAWQIAGYSVATLAGVVIVMSAVQFYIDLGGALGVKSGSGTNLVSPRNMVISKPVGLGNTLTGSAPSFDADEIADIEAQPWVSGVSAFQASDFGVWAGVDFGGRSLSSAMFFESIPDRLVDASIRGFDFDPESPLIPIVISKDYLALYNFGFATSGGMPVVSEGIISSIPLRVTLSGNGRRDTFDARIVGFSNWINTICVPQSFMDWAHDIYGSGIAAEPSRLIVEVSDPSDPAVGKYMSHNNYIVAGPEDTSSRATYLLRIVSASVAAVGAVITLLALFILVLSLFLLIQKNGRSIAGLLLLGYTPAEVSRYYMMLVGVINAAVLLLSVLAVLLISGLWTPTVRALGASPASPWAAIAVGVAVLALITSVNCFIIRRMVAKYF